MFLGPLLFCWSIVSASVPQKYFKYHCFMINLVIFMRVLTIWDPLYFQIDFRTSLSSSTKKIFNFIILTGITLNLSIILNVDIFTKLSLPIYDHLLVFLRKNFITFSPLFYCCGKFYCY